MQWHADILSIEFCESWQYLESCHLHKHKGKAFPSLQKSGSLGMLFENFPNGTLVESAWSGRSIGKRNGKPLLFCLGNLMDRGAWWAIVHGVAKESDVIEQLTLSLHFMEIVRHDWVTKGFTSLHRNLIGK